MTQIVSATVSGATLGCTYALVALGIVLIFRATATFNFAHGYFMLLAAYLVGKGQLDWGVPFGLVVVIALAVAGAVGWLLFRVLLRLTIGAPPFVGVIATLGFASVASSALAMVFGPREYTIAIPWLPRGSFLWAGAHISKASVVLAALSLVVAVLTAVTISHTRFGVKVRAAGQDVLLASQSGINVHRVYAGSWAASCVLAGLAGVTYASSNSVTPDLATVALAAFPALLLGGLDSIEGAIVGGLLIGLVQAFTAFYLGGEWTSVTTYSVLLAVILVRPSGLFGTRTVVRV